MSKCKACGREFASTNPNDEICYPCKNALKRLNGYAVPVVRCKDCVWYENGKSYDAYCNHPTDGMNYSAEDDFCSYGERKENE